MTMTTRTGLGIAILLGLAAAACTTDDGGNATDGGTDTSIPDSGHDAADTSVPDAADAGSDAGDASDASDAADTGDGHIDPSVCANEAVDGGEAGVTCNPLTLDAPAVHAACGAKPTAAGGTIAAGTYFLTSLIDLSDACLEGGTDAGSSLPDFAAKLVVTGNCAQDIQAIGGGTPFSLSYAFTTSGTTFSLTTSCPTAGNSGTAGYTATATTLTLINDAQKNVQVFTKQ